MLKPLDARLDLLTADFKRDPRPTLARVHTLGEVLPVRIPIFGNVHFVASHRAVTALLKDHRRFVQNPSAAGVSWLSRLQPWMPRTMRAVSNSMITQDDPEHRRLRGLVDQAFSRRGLEILRPRIADVAERLLDRMAAQAGPDLVEDFARRLPLIVIADLLGLPEEDHAKLQVWAQGFVQGTSPWQLAMTVPRLQRMGRYLRRQIDAARTSPRPGLLRELIAAEADGDRLDDDEILAMAFLLFFAGHETTTHLISVGTLALLQHPQTLERLRAEPERWSAAVEELLRFTSVVEMTKPRYVAEACEIHGVAFKRGQMLFAWLEAANFDPEVFEDPDRFDIARKPNPHLAFGTGIHFCLGHQLARIEAETALRALFERYPKLSLGIAEADLAWTTNLGIRGVAAMPVALAATA